MPEDKANAKTEILDKLIEATKHGGAYIKWADYTVVLVEKVDLENVKITK